MKPKNLLFLTVALGIGISAVAQPTLNKNNFAPQIGDHTNQYMISGYSEDEGTLGANQTWDYSNVDTGTVQETNYISCSSSPDCAGNPGTTIVSKESNGGYVYYIIDNNKMSIKGLEIQTQSQMATFHYSDPEEIMHFPFTYNDSYSDSTACVGNVSGTTLDRNGYNYGYC